ncbi:mitochondrial carrier [Jaminaea rosea]|uniref:Mitochondrial carrier n=1 Tax=Jaminaea rosea TaxID=1569628 RepID=A0A316UTK0_9BASI|nr:mitochondrial carrier [Jaminaea rosea]PWN28324.1 mitochondrial carrier [Jaminaea rosea]
MPALGPSAIAGACAGLVSSIVTCPLDVVKTKLQAQTSTSRAASSSSSSSSATATASTSQLPRPPQPTPPPRGGAGAAAGPSSSSLSSASKTASSAIKGGEEEQLYKGLVGTLRRIYRDDGIRGFYRGLGPTIFGYLPTWAIYFTVYDGSKEFLARRGGIGQRGGGDQFFDHIISAMTAGAASTVCTSPLWVVKTRFMLQSTKSRSPTDPPPYKHTLDAFVRIMQTEGPRGFYRGLLPSLLGVSHVAVQFPLYESLKGWARDSPLAASVVGGEPGERELPAQVILLCSSTAKMIASVLTYPHEVVRTRLQMQPRGKAVKVEQGGQAASAAATAGPSSTHSLQGSVDSRRGYSTSTTSFSSATSIRRPPSLHHQPARHLFTSSRTAASEPHGLKYSGVIRTVKTIFVEEGVRGFYNGMGVNLVRTVPSSALTILTYEVMMGHLTQPHRGGGDDHGGGGGGAGQGDGETERSR